MVSVLPSYVPGLVPAPVSEPLPSRLTRPPVDLEVIIPAFNERRRLPATIGATTGYLAAQRWSSAVVVVDNNSVDSTLEALERFTDAPVAVHVIGCSDQGKGAAVRRGIMTSAARYIGFADADNATPIATLEPVMALLADGHGAVIASREIDGARRAVEQSALRRAGGRLFRALARLTLPDIADSQCGFKFFPGPLAREIAASCHVDGFAFDVELLARVLRAGHDVVEVPVVWTDVPGSTFSAGRDGLRSMADLLRISLAR
ncbi:MULTISPECIES: glycosyltransferase [Streptomyces]|uniref:Glycosyltransferase n=1 Tax=Streptomyces solicathayae TaxID=3081768 RepID=A0ABZ0M4H3_9ACTN|nr:glycosyltransferase [Streptomyces sp. HUAS YS2]WOX26550.1 glycosyltransferase [Streptomyces sp. HUAS YS2]